MEDEKVKVLSGFRLTIPEDARQRLSINIGEELAFAVEGNRLVYKVKELPDDPVFSMLGLTGREKRKLSEVEHAIVEEIEEKSKRSSN